MCRQLAEIHGKAQPRVSRGPSIFLLGEAVLPKRRGLSATPSSLRVVYVNRRRVNLDGFATCSNDPETHKRARLSLERDFPARENPRILVDASSGR